MAKKYYAQWPFEHDGTLYQTGEVVTIGDEAAKPFIGGVLGAKPPTTERQELEDTRLSDLEALFAAGKAENEKLVQAAEANAKRIAALEAELAVTKKTAPK